MTAIRLGLAAFLAAWLPAQTCVHTSGSDPAGSLPPRATGRSFLYPGTDSGWIRRHLLVPATLFANVPLRITDFSLPVREGWRQLRIRQFIVRMGHTTRTQLSTTFAQNITSPLQDVLVANDYVVFEGIGPAWVPLGLQQSFQFLPGHGNLLVEVIQSGVSSLEQVAYTGLADGYVGSLVASAFESSVPATGSVAIEIPRFRFCFDQPELSLSGIACGGSTNTPPTLGLAGEPVLGSHTTFWLGNAPASSLAFLAFGFDGRPPYPLDLGTQGAPGCRQYFPVATALAVLTDGFGLGQYALPIPNNLGLAGQYVLGQYIALRPASNALGLLTSNYGRVLIGR